MDLPWIPPAGCGRNEALWPIPPGAQTDSSGALEMTVRKFLGQAIKLLFNNISGMKSIMVLENVPSQEGLGRITGPPR